MRCGTDATLTCGVSTLSEPHLDAAVDAEITGLIFTGLGFGCDSPDKIDTEQTQDILDTRAQFEIGITFQRAEREALVKIKRLILIAERAHDTFCCPELAEL